MSTTDVNNSCVSLGANAINWRVTNSKFGRNTKVRYIVQPTATSHNGICDNNIFEALNTAVTNPACIFNSGANNLKLGTLQVNTTGKPLTYP